MSEEMKKNVNEVSTEEMENVAGGASSRRYITYTVVKGDTLTKIAHRYGVTVNDLVYWNGIKNPNLILPGQVLRIYC